MPTNTVNPAPDGPAGTGLESLESSDLDAVALSLIHI